MTAVQDTKNTYDDPTVGDGLRDWLDRLAPADGTPATAFDTRIGAPPILTGAASKGIAARLGAHGYRLPVPRESFLVTKDNALVDLGDRLTAAAPLQDSGSGGREQDVDRGRDGPGIERLRHHL